MQVMVGTFFFMSVGFPTIFALGICGLGKQAKFAGALIVMLLVGAALASPFMGHIADKFSICVWVSGPYVGFVFIAIYGAAKQKPETWDSEAG
jgi:FHS family L-fucose permease-like MFS transporter